ncbi:S41 family peptidase (plasmid) [Pedobacter sp. BS3]|uniref:S41 family peptidase n=1 Tax=Pedobacter sp. BS3 TaxID=2567937 RepID=UPI0011EDEF9F|nr:S41 family peptidase [Pedobacter sp. BS3]TZF86306.1 S41 family peptidase [Pedobacter sp. BS3]
MRPQTKNNLIIAACYTAVFIVGMVFGPKFSKENHTTKNGTFLPFTTLTGRSEKVDKVLQIIDNNYVDAVAIDTLQNTAIQGILKQLDPHSSYLPPSDARLMKEDLDGNFNGIGIEYYLLNDTLLVTVVKPNGPADKAGLKRGDKIIRIGGKNIAGTGVTANAIADMVRGARGSTIVLSVKRAGSSALKDISVSRDRIIVSSIDVAYMLNHDTGYIKISKFGSQTDADFSEALEGLLKQHMNSLVLDLRGNGGGYLNAATALADQFLPDRKLIVYTMGKHEPRVDYYATARGEFEKGNLVILIDENTASASEIVAGAIQDLDRGTIVGRRSFGKGLVQEQFDFGDGSALNLTVARYYTPSGRSIQRSYKDGRDAYFQEIGNRFKSGEMTSTGQHVLDSFINKTRIYRTSAGRKIYAGGGIMPDVYVPVDTSGFTGFYYDISLRGLLNDFVFSNICPKINPQNLDTFLKTYQVSDKQWQQIIALAKADQITAGPEELKRSRQVISTELKALVARYFFGDEGYYRVLNANDNVLARSLEVLKKGN